MKNTNKEKRPHFEVIPGAIDGESLASNERRKDPRSTLCTEIFHLASNEKNYGILDLSISGMRIKILEPDELAYFTLESTVEGVLSFRRERYTVQAVVRHRSTDQIGLEFKALGSEIREKIRTFLKSLPN